MRRNIRLQRTAAAIVAVVAVLCARDARGAVWADEGSAARIQVEPRQAEVYVDGQFAGLVDDFDGISQRLYAKPGEHQVEIYLNGYQTAREKVLFRPGVTLKLKAVLQPLAPGEAQPPRPQPASPPADSVPGSGTRGYSRQAPPDAISIDPAPAQPDDGTAERSVFGTLSIRVQPRDAVVFVDGERWEGGEGGTRLVIELAEGTHRVEVQKPGYTTYTTEIRVRRGRVTTLNVSLLTAGEV